MEGPLSKKLKATQRENARTLRYWTEELRHPDNLHPTLSGCGRLSSSFVYNLPIEVSDKLLKLSVRNDRSLQVILISLVSLLISKFNQYGRFNIGVIHEDGFETNFQPVVVFTESVVSYKDFLLKTRAQFQTSESIGFVDLESLLNESNAASSDELFPLMLFFGHELPLWTSKVDLPIVLQFDRRDNQGIDLVLHDNGSLIPDPRSLLSGLSHLMFQATENLSTLCGSLQVVTDSQFKELRRFSKGKDATLRWESLPVMFDRNVAESPGATAVVDDEGEMSYQQLSDLSTNISNHLQEGFNVRRGMRIAVICRRGRYHVASALGIVKAGACFITIDPSLPAERIQYMIEDSGVALIVQTTGLAVSLGSVRAWNVDTHVWNETLGTIVDRPRADDAAYIIYSSGTTGKPKGAVITHRAIVNMLSDQTAMLDINSQDRILQFASASFDASIFEIFVALGSGATLVTTNELTIADPVLFTAFVAAEKISCMLLPPVYLAQLDKQAFRNVRLIAVGGEAPNVSDLRLLKEVGVQVFNLYGPSEAAVITSGHPIDIEVTSPVPIGTPMHNTQYYVLNSDLNFLPTGVNGELYIGGLNVGNGYVNQPELTASRFVPNPFDGGTMYKTGDVACWLPDGLVVIKGRTDDQVKIRGYRIELLEIQTHLSAVEAVKECAVIADAESTGGHVIRAFFTSDSALSNNFLRDSLARFMPGYMVPSTFCQVPRLPMNHSGKVDKVALLKLMREKIEADLSGDTTDANEIEVEIREIWKSVLGRSIGLSENFFRAGGDSIKAIQVVSRLIEKGYTVRVRDVFANPTVRSLAIAVGVSKTAINSRSVVGNVVLSPIQKFFFDQSPAEPWHFNQSMIISLKRKWHRDALLDVLQRLVDHHDALRIVFNTDSESVVQFNRDVPGSVWLGEVDIQAAADTVSFITKTSTTFQQSLSLDGNLVRFDHFIGAQEYLAITIHHLVVDAVSWGIILSDLERLMIASASKVSCQLPAKSASWQEWTKAISEQPVRLYKSDIVFRLPTDSRFGSLVGDCGIDAFELDETWTNAFVSEVGRAFNCTVEDVLLAGFFQAVFSVWDINQCSVAVETHGRFDHLGLDVSRTVGWFTALFNVNVSKVDVISDNSAIISIKEKIRESKAFAFEQMHRLSQGEHDSERPSILFNYLGAVADGSYQEFELSGIDTGPVMSGRRKRWYDLEVTGVIKGGRLVFGIVYPKQYFDQNVISRLLIGVKENIVRLCQYAAESPVQLTPSDLTAKEFDSSLLRRLQGQFPDIEDVYPLTPMQEGIFYHHLLNSKGGYYFTQLGYTSEARIAIDHLDRAFRAVVERHEVLRTHFIQDASGKPFHLVRRDVTAEFKVDDISMLDEAEAFEFIRKATRDDRQRNFDLSRDLMMRFRVFEMKGARSYLLWTYHHIILDGWGLNILVSEMMKKYVALVEGMSCEFDEAPAYRNYIRWINDHNVEASYLYWEKYLSGYSPKPLLPVSNRRSDLVDPFKRKDKSIVIDAETTAKFNAKGNELGVTSNVLVQALWSMLLSRYSGEKDVVFGTIVSGRPSELPQMESMVGLFINTVCVRAFIDPTDMFAALVKRMSESVIEAETHQYCSLAEIQSRIQSTTALFDHILLFENFPVANTIQTSAMAMNSAMQHTDVFDVNNYPFTLVVVPGNSLHVRINFNDDVYDDIVVDQILLQIENCVRMIANGVGATIGSMMSLPSPLIAEILVKSGDEVVDIKTESIPKLFRRVVSRYSTHLALSDIEGNVTYSQLDEKTDHLAKVLKVKAGVGRGDVVAIHLDRSNSAIISILGVLKAGATYLPLDTSWPDERKQFVLKDAGAVAMICTFGDYPLFNQYSVKLLAIDMVMDSQIPSGNIDDNIEGEDVAYIIYTSGSTGNPKGVPITHRSNINMALDQIKRFGIEADQRVLQFAPLFFDASIYEWSIALYSGATLCIAPDSVVKNPEAFVEYVEVKSIDMVTLPPPFFNLIKFKDKWPRVIVQAGSLPDAQLAVSAASHTRVFNAYGPTECAVCSTVFEIDPHDSYARIPVGRPVANNSTYVLDEKMNVLPIGVEGDIYVSGDNVSFGYIGAADDRNSAFMPDPFKPVRRMYRTGDRGRWLPGYQLEFRGRVDRQVKRRGYRIELAEIEGALSRVSGISHSAVTLKFKDAEPFVIAVVVTGDAIDERMLRDRLAKHLPTYMLPDRFVMATSLPVTPNGKVDYAALAELDGLLSHVQDRKKPVNEIESTLYLLWKENLGHDNFGTKDKYFESGGNSLSLIRLHAKVRELFPSVLVTDIFQYNTIADMATHISTIKSDGLNLKRIPGNVVPAEFLVPSRMANNIFSFVVTKGNWTLVRGELQLDSTSNDDDLLISLFSFAISESIHSQLVKLCLLDYTGRNMLGVVEIDFADISSREALIENVRSQRLAIISGGEKLDLSHGVNGTSENGEISFAFWPAVMKAERGFKQADVVLHYCKLANGDVVLTLEWNTKLLDSAAMTGLGERLRNIVLNIDQPAQ